MVMQYFDPLHFVTELVYTLIVIFLFLFVYYKTKEMYDITKYEGIKYFRLAFLFFSFAYLTRFLFFMLKLTIFSDYYFIPGRYVLPFVLAFIGYFSTMAISYLTYSILYKNTNFKSFLVYSNIAAIVIAIISYFTASPIILAFIQLPLIIFILWTNFKTRTNSKLLYVLISIFWLINLFLLTTKNVFSSEIKIILQFISLFVFVIIIKKVIKWTK